MRIITSPSGVRIGIAGARKSQPAPTLLVLATGIEQTLSRNEVYAKSGRFLSRKGFIHASVDVPCHGHDLLPGETGTMEAALWDWRKRIEQGSALVPEFTAKVSAAIDFLIASGCTDPDRIAVCGNSRGGFMALHAAAADERIKCAAAFVPVTDLLALREFEGMDTNPTVNDLALRHHAHKLAGRPVWIAIGSNDTRVSTDCAVELARKITGESIARGLRPLVDLHVVSAEGHSLHPTARKEAAEWIAQAVQNDV